MKISIILEALTGAYITDMKRSEKETKRAVASMVDDFKKFGAIAAAAGGAAAFAAFKMAKESLDAADQLNKAAASIGISAKALSELNYVAKLSDVSLQDLSTGVVQLTKRMTDGSAAFEAIGVNTKDAAGKMRSADEVFRDVAEVFSILPEGVEQTRLAVDLFGDAGAKLIPMLNSGRKGLQEMGDEARSLGVVLDTETGARAEEFNDTITKMGLAVDGIVLQSVKALLPEMQALATRFADPQFREGIATIVTGSITAIKWVGELVVQLGELAKFGGESFAAAFNGPDPADIVRLEDAIERQKRLIESLSQRGWMFGGTQDFSQSEAVIEEREELKRLEAQLEAATQAAEEHYIAQDRLRKAAEAATQGAGAQVDATGDLAKAQADLERRMKSYLDSLNKSNASGKEAKVVLRAMQDVCTEFDPVLQQLRKSFAQAEDAAADFASQRQNVTAFLDDLRFEASLIGMSNEARERTIALRQAGAAATAEERAEILALIDTIRDGDAMEAAAQEFQSIWLGAANSVGDAFTTALFDGAEAGADAITDVMEQLARDLVRFWLQQRIVIPLQQQMMGGSGGYGQFGSAAGWAAAAQNGPPASMAGGGDWMDTAGGWATGALSAYAGWRNAANGGSRFATVASFTQAGAAIGTVIPVVGTLVGAVVGAIVGVLVAAFKKVKPPDFRIGGADASVRGVEGSFETVFGTIQAGSRQLRYEELIEPMQQFDEQIATIVQSFGNGTEQLEAVRARLATWVVDLRGDAATAENVLESRFGAILSTFGADVQQFVNGADELQDRVQRLADSAFIEAAAEAGDLLDDFTALAGVLTDVREEGETIEAVYARVAESTSMLEDALGLLGNSLDLEREAFIRFATDIVEAAGGLDRANALWEAAFRFFSPTEIAQFGLESARQNAVDQLADIGLDTADYAGVAGGRRLLDEFNARLPTLGADAIVEWLEALEALGLVLDAQDAYNASLGQSAEAVQLNADGAARYADVVAGLNRQLAEMDGVDEFEAGLFDIAQGLNENIAALHEAARAAGLQAAREEDLALARRVADRQMEQALRQLEVASRELVQSLFGVDNDAAIARLQEQFDASTDGLTRLLLGGRIDALQAEQDAADAASAAAARFAQGNELAQIIAHVAGGREQTFDETLAMFGVTRAQLSSILSVDPGSQLDELLTDMQASSYDINDIAAAADNAAQLVVDALYDLFGEQTRTPEFGTLAGDPAKPIDAQPIERPTWGKSAAEEVADLRDEVAGLHDELARMTELLGRIASNSDGIGRIADTAQRAASDAGGLAPRGVPLKPGLVA